MKLLRWSQARRRVNEGTGKEGTGLVDRGRFGAG